MTAGINPNQTREKAIERVKAWPKWKREAFTYRKPEGCIEDSGKASKEPA